MKHYRKRGQITFVTGPPGSGKTTWCTKHAVGRDIIWDLDRIAAALNPYYGRKANRTTSLARLLRSWRSLLIQKLADAELTNNAFLIITHQKTAETFAAQCGGQLVTLPMEENNGTISD